LGRQCDLQEIVAIADLVVIAECYDLGLASRI
jgi:hypothetical protein